MQVFRAVRNGVKLSSRRSRPMLRRSGFAGQARRPPVLKPACPKSPSSRRQEMIWISGKQEGNGPCLLSFPDVPDFLIQISLSPNSKLKTLSSLLSPISYPLYPIPSSLNVRLLFPGSIVFVFPETFWHLFFLKAHGQDKFPWGCFVARGGIFPSGTLHLKGSPAE